MLRRDGTGQADATVGDGPHRDPSQRLGDEPLCVPNPVCAPAAAAALFRAADPAAHQLTLVNSGSIAALNSISLHRHERLLYGASNCLETLSIDVCSDLCCRAARQNSFATLLCKCRSATLNTKIGLSICATIGSCSLRDELPSC